MFEIIDLDGNIIMKNEYRDVLEQYLNLIPSFVQKFRGYKIIERED